VLLWRDEREDPYLKRERKMRKLLLALILTTGIGFVGCTSAQVTQVEQDVAKVLQVAVDTVDQLQNNPQAIAGAEAALSTLAAVAPQTGPIHQAIVDAQAALNALQNNTGSLDNVKASLEKVIALLEGQGSLPHGRILHKAAPKK
jgi:hypothetical protein